MPTFPPIDATTVFNPNRYVNVFPFHPQTPEQAVWQPIQRSGAAVQITCLKNEMNRISNMKRKS